MNAAALALLLCVACGDDMSRRPCGGGGGRVPTLPYAQSQLAVAHTDVWELGDSITFGSGSGGTPAGTDGYRHGFYDWAVAQGYSMSFVGSGSNGSWPNPLHDGHPGFTIEDLNPGIIPHYGAFYGPADLIIYLIATNQDWLGSGAGYNPSLWASDYATQLNTIQSVRATSRIMVSTITPHWDVTANGLIQSFNTTNLPAVWNAFDVAHPTKKLLRADLNTAIGGPTHVNANFVSSVDVHPNATGYALILAEWIRVLTTQP